MKTILTVVLLCILASLLAGCSVSVLGDAETHINSHNSVQTTRTNATRTEAAQSTARGFPFVTIGVLLIVCLVAGIVLGGSSKEAELYRAMGGE